MASRFTGLSNSTGITATTTSRFSGLSRPFDTRPPTQTLSVFDRISRNESGGNYQAKGPVVKSKTSMYYGDRAYGKYQIMGKNIPSWSKQALGRSVTLDEYLKNPAIQESIIKDQYNRAKSQGLSDEQFAAKWFSGSTNTKSQTRDELGTTTQQYVERFNAGTSPASRSIGSGLMPGVIGAGGKNYPTFESGYGASFRTDSVSGTPLLQKTTPQFRVTSLPDRVATTFDITKPQKLENFSTTRMPKSASDAIREEVGATTFQQLDHVMPLALGGSNQNANLALVDEVNGKQPLVGKEIELWRKALKGEISVLGAWQEMARLKGISLKEDQPKDDNTSSWNPLQALKDFGTAIVEQYTKPSQLTREVEKVFRVNAKTAPVPALQPIEDAIGFLSKVFIRTFTPLVAPLGKDIGERILLREIVPKIESGEIPASVINEFETLTKTNPQIVGDVATAVLSAYSPTIFKNQAILFKNAPLSTAVTRGAVAGAESGVLFGTSQALSSGSTDPGEIASIVTANVVTMGVLGAITSGVIPAVRGVREKVAKVQAQIEKDLIAKGYSPAEAKALAQRGGYVGELPSKKEPTSEGVEVPSNASPAPKAADPFADLRKERGFVSSVKEEFPQIKVSGQYIPRSTDRLATRASNLVKDDIVAAEKMALELNDKGVAVTSELLKQYDRQATEALDQTVKDTLYQKAADLANTKARQLTEAGRTVQAASILSRLTPEGQVRFAAREIQKYNEAIDNSTNFLGLKRKIPELTGDQAKVIIAEMKAIEAMPDGQGKIMRFQKLQNSITDLVPTPLFKKIVAKP